MTATVYPALDLFWTLLEFSVFVLWVWLIIVVIRDVFRSADLSGWAKALWTLFVVVLPWVGVVVYLIARGSTMSQRLAKHPHADSGDTYSPPTQRSPEPLAATSISDPPPM